MIIDNTAPAGNWAALEPATAGRVVELFKSHFLNRFDRLAYQPKNGNACPLDVGEHLDQFLLAHLVGHRPKVSLAGRGTSLKKPEGWDVKGPQRLGTYSPALDGTTRFACFDFDGSGHSAPLADPLAAAVAVQMRLGAKGCPSHLERSKGGKGWHLWVFFAEPVAAGLVRRALLSLVPGDLPLATGGFAKAASNVGVELFPKQASIVETPARMGNQVYLPMWHGAKYPANWFHRIGNHENGGLEPYLPESFTLADPAVLEAVAGSLPAASNGKACPPGGKWTTATATSSRPAPEKLVNDALAKFHGKRNDGGFWLACQFRDNGYTADEALRSGAEYVRRASGGDHPYTAEEYAASVGQAFARSRREPWGDGKDEPGEPASEHDGDGPPPPGGTAGGGPAKGKANAFRVGDLELRPGQPRRTDSGKISVPVAAYRAGVLVYPFQITTADSSRKTPARQLAAMAKVAVEEADAVLIAVMADAADRLEKGGKPEGPGLRDVIAGYLPPALQLTHQTKRGGLWSEAKRREISRQEWLSQVSSDLLAGCAKARDAPQVELDLIRAVRVQMEVVWGDLMRTLPAASDVNLAETTEAGRLFRRQLVDLWHKPQTWEVRQGTSGGSDVASRASLASRVRHASAGSGVAGRQAWVPVQDAFAAWWRPHVMPGGEERVVLAMRYNLAVQLGVEVTGADDQPSLGSLGEQYGCLMTEGCVTEIGLPDRLTGGSRLAVLSLSLTDELLAMPEEPVDEAFSDAEPPQ